MTDEPEHVFERHAPQSGENVYIERRPVPDPTQLTTVGLDPNTTKILLQTFSVIFFGIRTFLGIAILIVNLYRIITVKNKRKIGYII